MQDYHDLLVWKRAMGLVSLTYRMARGFPKEELYGLTSQLKRAVISVVANIVEGRGKPTDKDFLRYLYISNGSLEECRCYYEIALELGFIEQKAFDYIETKRKEVSFLLYRLIYSIKAS